MKSAWLVAGAVAGCLFPPAVRAEAASALVLAQRIVLPGVQGGMNHMSIDAAHQRLFAAAPTNQTVEIVDLASGRPWRSLTGAKPAAVRFAPEFNQLYASRGEAVFVYDGQTLAATAQVELQSNVDELQYDPTAAQLYAGCMTPDKTAIAIVHLPDGKLLGKVRLPAKPQGFVIERRAHRIFANLPNAHQVAVIDLDRMVLLRTWPVAGAEGNSPLALDEAGGRLFVGCRQPAQLIVFDTATGRPIASVPIEKDTDDLFFDAAGKRVYVSCGEGFVDVIEQRDADHYVAWERIPTLARTRTSAWDGALQTLCLCAPQQDNRPAEILVYRAEK